ncbi:MAG: hypothetical protein J6Y13_10840, partial [Treponema sp.]|nr:hypothetical protein [Treponema sp.]
MLVSSCSKGGSLSSAGAVSAGAVSSGSQSAGQQVPDAESGAGQAGTALSPAVMQAPDAATAVLARAEKTLPYTDRADLEKLDAVLKRLSERAREAIP